jgi:hypothetical protein
MALMNSPKTLENAEILALTGLEWLAGDQDGIQRFLDQSGTDTAALRQAAGSPEMAVAVLDFLLTNEDLLLRFCESAAISPKELHLAHYRLGGTL